MHKENRASDETLREIGLRVRHIRGTLGMQQEKMANDLTINRSVLSNIENGKVSLSFDVMYALYHKLDINLHYVLDGSGAMFRSGDKVMNLDGIDAQMNLEDMEFFRYYMQSSIVRLESLSKFNMLLNKERELIEREIERKKNKDQKSKV